MKKAKIILTAITVLAVVGGALAFKAKRTPFPAFIVTGQTITSFIRNGLIYRTVVPLCTTSKFIDPDGSPLVTTFIDLVGAITGYTTVNGVPLSATSFELVCTPILAATTNEF
jgi:hypothetical protein